MRSTWIAAVVCFSTLPILLVLQLFAYALGCDGAAMVGCDPYGDLSPLASTVGDWLYAAKVVPFMLSFITYPLGLILVVHALFGKKKGGTDSAQTGPTVR